jgi:hypothetical protein
VDFWKFMDKNPTSNAYANSVQAGEVVMPSNSVQASPDQPLFVIPNGV